MMLLNYLILIVLPIAVISDIPDAYQKCVPLLIEADKCFAPILFLGDRNIKQIKDHAELKGYCRTVDAGQRCMQKWGKCLPPREAMAFDIGFRAVPSLINSRCENSLGKTAFLAANKCINPAVIKSTGLCIANLNKIFDILARDNRQTLGFDIESMCCSVSYGIDCIKTVTKRDCGGETNLGQYMESQAMHLIGPFGKALCGKLVKDFNECKQHRAEMVALINAAISPSRPSPNNGIFVTLMQIFHRLAKKHKDVLGVGFGLQPFSEE